MRRKDIKSGTGRSCGRVRSDFAARICARDPTSCGFIFCPDFVSFGTAPVAGFGLAPAADNLCLARPAATDPFANAR